MIAYHSLLLSHTPGHCTWANKLFHTFKNLGTGLPCNMNPPII